MSLEEDMFTKYAATLAGRLYWDTSPYSWGEADRKAPFGILQKVGGANRQYVDDTEQPEFLTARVQLYMWGSARAEVANAMRSFAAEVMASNTEDWYARSLGEPVDDYNEVLKLRGSRQDFSISYRNPHFIP